MVRRRLVSGLLEGYFKFSNQLTGSLIYKLKGFDPDGDALDFGVQSTYDSDIISVRNLESNEAGIYLEKELDREVS